MLRLPPIPHEIPIPPTLHEIINKNPQGPSSGRRNKGSQSLHRAYPSLPSLSLGEITHDLDYLFNHRWPPESLPSRYESFVPAAPPGMAVVLDVSPYGRPPPPVPPPRRRYPPGRSGLQNELEHGPGPFSRPLTPQHGTKVNGWVPNAGVPRPGESGYDREEIEIEHAKERERDYFRQQLQQQQHLQAQYMMQQQPQQPQPGAPTRPIPHPRSDSHLGPGQGPALPPPQSHHPSSGHHHHHLHYHHVHHHHHNSSSAPPSTTSQPPPPISPLHTPYDGPRLPTRELEPSRTSATEVINLTPSNAPLPPRQQQWEREREPPSPRYRERERDRDRDRDRDRERERERERERDRADRGRPASGPPPTGPHERIMTPLNAHAPLPPPPTPRSSRGSFSESAQPQPPQPPSQGGTPLGSPVRSRALPGRMVSPGTQLPAAAAVAPSQPSSQPTVLLQAQGPMSPPKPPRMPPPPMSPSSKPMDGERERVVLPLPPLPPPPPPPSLASAPPPMSPHAHAHTHRMSLPPPPPLTLPQGQSQSQSQALPPPPPPPPTVPPPGVPVAAGDGA